MHWYLTMRWNVELKAKVWVLILGHPVVENLENKTKYKPYLKLWVFLMLIISGCCCLHFVFQSVGNIHSDAPKQANCIEKDFLLLWTADNFSWPGWQFKTSNGRYYILQEKEKPELWIIFNIDVPSKQPLNQKIYTIIKENQQMRLDEFQRGNLKRIYTRMNLNSLRFDRTT